MPATVSGTVTLDGNPLPKGKLRFVPAAGGPHAIALINSDGSFSVRTATRVGIATGSYSLAVTAYREVPGPTMSEAEIDELRLVPIKYWSANTSGLSCNIKKGENRLEVQLSSGQQ